MKKIIIFDTTLRDGTQGEGIYFTPEEKLEIAKRLDDFGIDYIEGGWPGSNQKDIDFFELARSCQFKKAKLVAFGSTRRANTKASEDQNIRLLLESGTAAVAIFGKSWDMHVRDAIRTTEQENLEMIFDSVELLKCQGREVVYDAEHFFDGYKHNHDYALKTVKAAVLAGASSIVLCDTNGGSLPFEIEAIVKAVISELSDVNPAVIGIHTHNDCQMAVANTIIAVGAGARMVQGTINGYGERCGNADLISIIPVLQQKMLFQCVSNESLSDLQKLSLFISEVANERPLPNRPFVGKSAFAHKGGIHVNAVLRNPRTYEHMNPEIVGNKRRFITSDLSGKSNIEVKADEFGLELSEGDIGKILSAIKESEAKGYQYESADASLKLFMLEALEKNDPFFRLESFRVVVEKDKGHPCQSHAIVEVSVGDRKEIAVAKDRGPVGALDGALRKALWSALEDYPDMRQALEDNRLTDYKVRIANGSNGTQALVRVLIESGDTEKVWRTIGVSPCIVGASFQAIRDSMIFQMSEMAKAQTLK